MSEATKVVEGTHNQEIAGATPAPATKRLRFRSEFFGTLALPARAVYTSPPYRIWKTLFVFAARGFTTSRILV